MGVGTSNFVIRWINFLTMGAILSAFFFTLMIIVALGYAGNWLSMLLAIAVIIFGVWMSTHHDSCRRSLTLPVLGLGAVIFVISIIGFLGALKSNSILLWIYLVMLCIILVAILVFTVLAFIITNNGSGHSVPGLRYKEYQLQDYSSWFLKQLNNTKNWNRLKSCLVKTDDCNNLTKKYKTIKQFKSAKLTAIEAGCCRPPSVCGYPAVNASYYDLSFHPISSNKDCKLYKNSRATKCYNCDSCKAGVAQYMKTEWRLVAIFNVILFVVLSMIYFVGCCARRSASRSHSKA
ncbi:tetraspanin-10 [Populus alba x Populus x berolinensis]|uniref:Tetraspanin-10 n=1 Tax=Populus alba x Populus x berolinensis TaxID=444605 RepID=A0AAD6WFQ4_9ROSI|nr:tetraspanin-10 [Populus alba x Populus x berolinensis]KAJ7010699.1 tetraspanin-10 [Populus alba x Populus x berolinensis]KAJ7010702.1 tetraspanin-10 [Populus alba x Populus x berolinensis]